MSENGISVAETARKLGLGLGYVYSLVWTGRLVARKENGRWLVSEEAIQARLKEGGN